VSPYDKEKPPIDTAYWRSIMVSIEEEEAKRKEVSLFLLSGKIRNLDRASMVSDALRS